MGKSRGRYNPKIKISQIWFDTWIPSIFLIKFHPDMNAGNKKFEDKLKVITLAYTQLKNTYRKKIDS